MARTKDGWERLHDLTKPEATVVEIALLLGMSRQNVYNIINKKATLPDKTVKLLEEKYGIPASSWKK